jgi:transposase-like protein
MTSTQIMVIAIVAIVMFASVIKARYGHGHGPAGRSRRGGRGHELDAAGAAENERLRHELTELKQRLAVLERITVEKENSLERQIEALRDA